MLFIRLCQNPKVLIIGDPQDIKLSEKIRGREVGIICTEQEDLHIFFYIHLISLKVYTVDAPEGKFQAKEKE